VSEGRPDDYLSETGESEGATQRSGAGVHASRCGSRASTIFDKVAFLAWVMDDEGLAFTIARMFLANMPVQIEKLAFAVGAGDCGQAEYQAHTIKGVSANVGGEALREVAFTMEKAAETGDLTALRALLPLLERRFVQLKEAMEKEF